MKDYVKYFPLSLAGKDTLRKCIIAVVMYAVACWAVGFVGALTGWLPLIGWLIKLVVAIARLYCFVGAVLTILLYAKKI